MQKKIIRITTVPMAFKVLLTEQIKFMRQHGFYVIMVSADGIEREDIMQNEGCEHIIVPMTRKITPFRDIVSLFRLRKLIRKCRPDIVHTHTPKAGLLGMIAAKSAGVKVRIHTVAGLPLMIEKGLKKQLLLFTEKLTYSSATEVWPNSNSMKNFIKEKHLVNDKKIVVIGNGSTNGVNLSKFLEKNLNEDEKVTIKKSLEADNKITILCVGRMVKDKGIEELVLVFKKLQRQYAVHLVLVGPFEDDLDPLSTETKNEILENPGISHINWSDSIEYYMSLADILVHPSHREGFPNVILQAGAMNLVVVCSDIPGNIDIVKAGKTALVFEVKNEDSLYSKLKFALDNREKTKEIALALHEEVLQLYDQKKVHQLILNRYDLLLNQYEK